MTLFRVVDLKQYVYCPRIVYYHHCLPQVRPVTFKMEAGLAAQDEEEVRAARRSLRAYGLRRGETESNVPVESAALGLRGQVDLVIKTDDNPRNEVELIPVDYKLSAGKLGRHFKLQLVAYGLLLAEMYDLPVRRGFLYAIPTRRAQEVPFTPALRGQLNRALLEMKEIVLKEFMPAPVRQRAKCSVCEFRRFCNDV
ncbi:MAG: CRISPR-associated protein Cas4 [Anaerolineae bacterium]|nr:CRISPR-associated protein Cas4 [Anaerolineae bacterium]MCB0181313.1 CRISPR-associated protein Cas4 [Anaerolineae bacterium]MCB0226160.1 CRISPR-associated protein Cas4 [Anaerolineae bacterium]